MLLIPPEQLSRRPFFADVCREVIPLKEECALSVEMNDPVKASGCGSVEMLGIAGHPSHVEMQYKGCPSAMLLDESVIVRLIALAISVCKYLRARRRLPCAYTSILTLSNAQIQAGYMTGKKLDRL